MTGRSAVQKTILFGDSHVHSIRQAAESVLVDGKPVFDNVVALAAANDFYEPFFDKTPNGLRLHAGKIRDRLVGIVCDEDGLLYPPDSALWLVSLGFHANTFLVSKRFDTHRYWRIVGHQDRSAISESAMKAMVYDISAPIISFYAALKGEGRNVVAVSAPPVTRRMPLLKTGYAEEDVIVMDRFFRDAIREKLEELEVEVVLPPEETSQGGFLRDEYLTPDEADVHHANADYSARLLSKIVDRLGLPKQVDRF